MWRFWSYGSLALLSSCIRVLFPPAGSILVMVDSVMVWSWRTCRNDGFSLDSSVDSACCSS